MRQVSWCRAVSPKLRPGATRKATLHRSLERAARRSDKARIAPGAAGESHQLVLPSLHSFSNFFASSPVSFFSFASFSQCAEDMCLVSDFVAGVADVAGVAVGVDAANAAPPVSSAAIV